MAVGGVVHEESSKSGGGTHTEEKHSAKKGF